MNQQHEQQSEDDNLPLSPGRGVKEDLSEITKTLTRQFWGVASLLAPSPPPVHANDRSVSFDPENPAPEAISGIRRDFAEIGGKFRNGISKLSNNIDVSEITKLASNLLQLESEDEDHDSSDGDDAVGVTDEVVAFARDIAMHPETWSDFPLPEDENDDEDFDMSEAQREHALAVEHLAPRLSALRIELCPAYMNESSFWKIYFVLLHPRLERHAAELLSTPKIMKVRASLTHELKNRSSAQSMKEVPRSNPYAETMPESESESLPLEVSAIETVKTLTHSDEIQIVDKSVIQEEPCEGKDEEDITADWLKEESSEIAMDRITIPLENDEDVSFSDLEEDDDDDGNIPIHYKKPSYV